jgi:hypothetical protein
MKISSEHGSAKNCIVFGEKGLYFKSGTSSGFLTYSELSASKISSSGESITIEEGDQHHTLECPHIKVSTVTSILESISSTLAKELPKSKRESKQRKSTRGSNSARNSKNTEGKEEQLKAPITHKEEVLIDLNF